jgi:hypothetical protein
MRGDFARFFAALSFRPRVNGGLTALSPLNRAKSRMQFIARFSGVFQLARRLRAGGMCGLHAGEMCALCAGGVWV